LIFNNVNIDYKGVHLLLYKPGLSIKKDAILFLGIRQGFKAIDMLKQLSVIRYFFIVGCGEGVQPALLIHYNNVV